jgi:hypothetical protein
VRDVARRQIKEMGKEHERKRGDESMNVCKRLHVGFSAGIILACLYMVSHYMS